MPAFGHFDNCHTENFAAAVLCLLMDLDAHARDRIVELVRERAGIELGPFQSVARERRLAGTDLRAYQRADICLLFQAGVVLIEVKTRDTWDVGQVIQQVLAQGSCGRSVRGGEVVTGMLLAPTALAMRVCERSKVPTMRWLEVIERLREGAGPLVEAAVTHLEGTVETTIGTDEPFVAEELDAAVRRVAILRALLETCARDIGQAPDRRKLNLTGQDGRPFRFEEWVWHGMSVPLKGGGHRRVGIYRYLAAPEGHEPSLDGAWLEVYLDDANRPAASVPFRPACLDPISLDHVRREFLAECQRLGVATTPLEQDVEGENDRE